LFGTYAGLRRPLLAITEAPSFPFKNKSGFQLAQHEEAKEKEEEEDEDDDENEVFINNAQLGCTALAGALAGSIQHTVSHYTEVIEVEAQCTLPWLVKKIRASPAPAARAVAAAAVPSAIGFIAYEYGREFPEAVGLGQDLGLVAGAW